MRSPGAGREREELSPPEGQREELRQRGRGRGGRGVGERGNGVGRGNAWEETSPEGNGSFQSPVVWERCNYKCHLRVTHNYLTLSRLCQILLKFLT